MNTIKAIPVFLLICIFNAQVYACSCAPDIRPLFEKIKATAYIALVKVKKSSPAEQKNTIK